MMVENSKFIILSIITGILILGISLPAENAFAITEAKITASNAMQEDWFGKSVSISGNTAIVGAAGRFDGLQGSAYIFEFNGTSWSQIAKFTGSDSKAGDAFGASVAISGDTAIVGAFRHDDFGETSGSAYIFDRNQGGANNWGEVKEVHASFAEAQEAFGQSVSISGDTAIVADPFDRGGIANRGAVSIFERDEGGAGNWGEVKKIFASDPAINDLFGTSVAIFGDTIIAGSPLNDDTCPPDDPETTNQDEHDCKSGSAYLFDRNQGGANNWGEVKKITASDIGAGDNFGHSVDISGDTAIVGAQFNNELNISAGTAYIFERDDGGANNWGEAKKIIGSVFGTISRFGSGVGISGDTAIAGMPNHNAGLTFIFERDEGGIDNWGEATFFTSSDGGTGDNFGHSVDISGNNPIVAAWGDDDVCPETIQCDSGAAYIFNLSAVVIVDGDSDGIPDSTDNCPSDSNSNQLDMDDDGTGDACDSENRITTDVTLTQSTTSLGDVIIQGGAVLTVNAGVNLDIDFTGNNLFVTSGSGVLVKAGASIS